MEQQETVPRARLRVASRQKRERTLVLVYLVLASLTLAHAVYLSYGVYFAEITAKHGTVTQQQYYGLHNTIALSADHPLFYGMDHAPNQYRVGIEYLGRFLGDRVGISKYYIVFSVFDFMCAVGIGWLSYAGFVGSEFFAALGDRDRPLGVVAMLAALAYPLAWVVSWQRPETLPTALYVVGALAMLGRLRLGGWWWAGLAAATVWQGAVRTDVPAVLGAAVVLLGSTSSANARQMFGSRARCFGAGAMVAGIAIAMQVYLQSVLFPHAGYPPDTGVIQLVANLGARPLITFVIAMMPWALILVLAVRIRRQLEAVDWVALIAACLYVPLWWTLGVVGEVRLYVPFLAGMVVVTAKVVVATLAHPCDESA